MLTLNRRNFIQTGCVTALAGATGLIALPNQAGAKVSFGSDQTPGFYRYRLGDFEIITLSDGYFELPSDSIATNAQPEERKSYFETHFIPQDNFRLQASPLLINTGEKLILVDTGIGPGSDWAPGAGLLQKSLEAAGVKPEMIDIVVLTHGHSDHIGGLTDTTNGSPRFPSAEVVLSDVELELWTSPDAAAHLPDWAAQGLSHQQRTFAALGDRLRPMKAGADIVTGVIAQRTPGHTQGHLSLVVGSEQEQLLVTGDAVANIHIAFDRPDWQIIWDHDRELGAKTRVRLLDQAASDRLLVTGYHYPFPGVGHVVREGSVYRWLPADWVWAL